MKYTTCDIDDLKIIMFSQQNGDCIHITINDKLGILIDTGKSCNYSRVKEQLKENNKKINYIFITHNHSDHIGAISNFLDDYQGEIKGVIKWVDKSMVFDFESIKMIKKISDFTERRKISFFNVKSIDEFNLLNKNIQILYPNKSHRYSVHQNKNSIIISFKIGDSFILFTGDATTVEENKLQKIMVDKNIYPENIKLIKLGHHGSKTSSRHSYIKNISSKNLKAVVCSCRDNWDKRPPHEDHIEKIKKIVKEKNPNCKFYFTGKPEDEYISKNSDIYIHCEKKSGNVEVNINEENVC